MSGKYEPHIKQLPISGRCGNIRLGAVMDGAFFGWDSFSVRYGLVDACGMIPEETDKQHTHEYDQMLWFIPADPDDMLTLGAELEISLGEKCIRHRFASPHIVTVPAGTPHFSPIVTALEKPFYFLAVSASPKLEAAVADASALPIAGEWSRFFGEFMNNVRPLSFSKTDPFHYGSERNQPTGGVSTFVGSASLGMKFTMAWSTIRLPGNFGPWMQDGLYHPHKHDDYDEALFFFSLDQDKLTELHGVVELSMGEEKVDTELYEISKASVAAVNKGIWHLPMVYKEVDYDKPMVFVTISQN